MEGITIPDDITKHYLLNVLKKTAPKLNDLVNLFEIINIDRVIQGYIDTIIETDKCKSDPNHAVFTAGQVDMGNKIKAFLSNLATARLEGIEQATESKAEELNQLAEDGYISKNDLSLLDLK